MIEKKLEELFFLDWTNSDLCKIEIQSGSSVLSKGWISTPFQNIFLVSSSWFIDLQRSLFRSLVKYPHIEGSKRNIDACETMNNEISYERGWM